MELVDAAERAYSRTKTHNTRRKRRLGFASHAPTATAQFVQPSKTFSNIKHPRTPPSLPHGIELVRSKQYQAQPSKSDFAKPGARRENKPKPYTLDPPAQAQIFPDSKSSDFHPWKGNHAEDTVTDAHARNGLSDKLFVGKLNNEQASARTSLRSLLKQSAGLSTLSYLLLAVVEKRNQYNPLSAPWTFKPPPRVTLPDQRREAWLKDLANPLVPLRRLSRTIPHGLKGPLLLDQCYAKNVPAARAVWFARCVGANELRGLKRKGVGSFGVGGEAKWIKDWTHHVIHFLEKTVMDTEMTSTSWRTKTLYADRLVSHLYAEHLVDRTILLEWLVSFLEKSSLELLAMNALLIAPFWDDLLHSRRYAHRLAEVLLAKTEQITVHGYSQLELPAIRMLAQLLSDVLLRHQNSIVFADRWCHIKPLLAKFVDTRYFHVQACIMDMDARNAIVCPELETSLDTKSDRRKTIDLLDSASAPFHPEQLYTSCAALLPHADLIICLCEWAVTPLRAGKYRVFLAFCMLRLAHEHGEDVQDAIHIFLIRLDSQNSGCKHDAYLLISELIRWKIFSVAAYLRWIIARGTLTKISNLQESLACHIRLLAEVPAHAAVVPPRVQNLRRILLAGCNFDEREEDIAISSARDYLVSLGIFSETGPDTGRYANNGSLELEEIQYLSRTVKSELGLWIKSELSSPFSRQSNVGRENWRDVTEGGISGLRLAHFLLIRQVLETTCDLSILVDVVKMFTTSESCDTLAAVADTISYHINTFSVFGSAEECMQLLFDKYKKLHGRRSLDKCFLLSLLELACLFTSSEKIKQELEFDLALYNQRYPRSAIDHSPVSDAMDDGLHDTDAERNEEIDRLWITGAIVDRDSVSRLFETTVSRLETSFEDADNQRQILASSQGLVKLHQLDGEMFSQLLSHWITRMLSLTDRAPLFRTLSHLIAGGCVEVLSIVDICLNFIRASRETNSHRHTGTISVQALALVVNENPFNSMLSLQELYTLRRRRKNFVCTFPPKFLQLIRATLQDAVSTQDEHTKSTAMELFSSKLSLEFLRELAVTDPQILLSEIVEPLSHPRNGPQMFWLQSIIDNLLDDHDSRDVDADVQVGRLLQLANDFSISMCQLKMRITFNVGQSSSRAEAREGFRLENTVARSFIRGIISTYKDRPTIWAQLLSVLDQECAAQIRMEAEELLLDSTTFMHSGALSQQLNISIEEAQENGELATRALLALLEATVPSIPQPYSAGLASTLVERLTKLVHVLYSEGEMEKSGLILSDSAGEGSSSPPWRCWLMLFLRIAILHRDLFVHKSGNFEQGRMLAGLCAIIQSDSVKNEEELFEFAFDVASVYADNLTEDTRYQLKRYLKGKTDPPLAAYLVGSTYEAALDGLKASQRGRFVDYPVKAWERLAEPAPNFGENDTSLSLVLFKSIRSRCCKL